ncbi:MAG: PaaI family thioesterase [Pseudomonadota bacterium]
MTDAEKPDHLEIMKTFAHQMINVVPWAKELGFELTDVQRGRVFGSVPWSEHLLGDPDNGVIHGGVITSLLDNLCGAAVVSGLKEFRSTATLDLRIDYMRPSDRDQDIMGEAECYHITRSVAFARAWAYQESRDRMIATATGAFALNDPKRWSSGLGKVGEEANGK